MAKQMASGLPTNLATVLSSSLVMSKVPGEAGDHYGMSSKGLSIKSSQLTKISAGVVGARAILVNGLDRCLGTRTLIVRKAKVIVRTEIEAMNVPPRVSEEQDKEKNYLNKF